MNKIKMATIHSAQLVLEDGSVFLGHAPRIQRGKWSGEVVFTTGMTGYVESLTDPSYAGQIVVFTYPLIGNYGVPPLEARESGRIWAGGVVASGIFGKPEHRDSRDSVFDWLYKEGVPVITGVDTRALTKRLRERGVMLGMILDADRPTPARGSAEFIDPNTRNLVAEVSIAEKKIYGVGKKKIIAVDCGMKESIIRELTRFDAEVHRVPYDYDYTNEAWDGVFISNGPGNPMMAKETVDVLRRAFARKKPIFGICLGSQIMGLACGGTTYKLPYGHRGQNQPCRDEVSGACYMTSQNHGYAVREDSLPVEWRVTMRNLNDGSVEGIAHARLPFFSVQFHPEAAPGPTDTRFLFERFYALL